MIKVIFKLTMVFIFGSALVYCQPDSKKNDSSKAVTNLLLLSTLSGGGGAPTGVQCYGKDFVRYVGEEIYLQCQVSGSRSSLTFSVSPELPAGLQLVNKLFGVGMEGTLTEISKKKDYKLTVKNPSGEVSTEFTFTVEPGLVLNSVRGDYGFVGGYAWDANNIILVGGRGTAKRSTDGEKNWTSITTGAGSTNHLFSTSFFGDKGYACGNQIMLDSNNRGSTWSTTTLTGVLCMQVQAMSATVGYAAFQNASDGSVYKTTNAGSNWSPVGGVLTSKKANSIHFLNENLGFVVGENGLIRKTTDGGTSWTDITSPAGASFTYNHVYFVDSNTGYIGGNSGRIFKSTDGGNSWTELSSLSSVINGNGINSVHFFDADNGFVAANCGGLAYTEDGGATWKKLEQASRTGACSSNLTYFLKGLIFPTSKKGFVYDFYMSSGVPYHNNVYEILR